LHIKWRSATVGAVYDRPSYSRSVRSI
jgi:hypothetical protein